jgi:ubiquinone/menaquinone biosynthesis C-methylase UbiE
MSEGHPIFALFYGWFGPLGDRAGFGELRRSLLAEARGTVVEVGAGTGLNLRHYPPEVELIATEPDPHMFKRAQKAARQTATNVTIRQASASSLPFDDASVDMVVSTLVLCSVLDQATTLAEIDRVLRPGGSLLLLEHVRSQDPVLALRQDQRERSHVRFAGGCHPNRDTLQVVAAAGFDTEAIERVTLPGFRITRPGIRGIAKKPAGRD